MENKGEIGQILLPSASADAQPMCGRETEDGKMGIIRGKADNGINSRNKGGVGQILLPLASFSFRKPQSASADPRAMYGREVEAIISTQVKAPPLGVAENVVKMVGRKKRSVTAARSGK